MSLSNCRLTQLLLKDKARLSYALRGAKDNPTMESFNGRFKGENHSLLLESQDLDELVEVVERRMIVTVQGVGRIPPVEF